MPKKKAEPNKIEVAVQELKDVIEMQLDTHKYRDQLAKVDEAVQDSK